MEIIISAQIAQCIYDLCAAFGQVNLVEHHGFFVQLTIPKVHAVGDLFTVIEKCKLNHKVGSYSVS